ncbi:hypothetical protein PCC8801_3329 [Rippkaea orientalis PCC 8801]|uniref:Uncharacterized protein n=1 Tax=Rippkaea orientalis (strain PCC 8801 / RF-1) TaxID=41431 RepID=B7JZ88_RIPO1|nr:hypothetical protein [Rippkaea orientalis]ACK67299.1 hypothetical protein PCC8801_3329 [Rippkaea orientalis PCC 8801]
MLINQTESFLTSKNSTTKNCIFYGFIILISVLVIQKFLFGKSFSTHVFQEWLINYTQGFVRRGLIGTILWLVHTQFSIDIADIRRFVQGFSYGSYLVFFSLYIVYIRQSIKILNLENLLVLLFLPSLVLFGLYDLQFMMGRKDFFYFYGLIINLFFLNKALKNLNRQSSEQENSLDYCQSPSLVNAVNKYSSSLFIWYNLISIPTALSHEALIFLGIPLNIIITANVIGLAFSFRQVLFRTLIIYLPTIVLCFLCLIFRGNEVIAQAICQQWEIIPSKCAIIDMLTSPYNVSSLTALLYIFAFLLNLVILMRTSSIIIENQSNWKKKKEAISPVLPSVNIVNSFHFKYFWLPLIFSLIMYFIGADWGRWFFMTSMSYAFCLLTPSLIDLEIASYSRNQWILERLSPLYFPYSKVMDYLNKQSLLERFYPLYLMGLIYTLSLLRISHYKMKITDLLQGLIDQLFHFHF